MDCTTKVLTPEGEHEDDAEAVASHVPEPFTLVIFGGSGDLAHRKLLPALYQLGHAGFLPEKYAVVGFSRSDISDQAYREQLVESQKSEGLAAPADGALLGSLFYVSGDNDDAASFERLERRLVAIEKERGLPGNRLYYLSVAPQFFGTIVARLARQGMIRRRNDKCWSRVVIEKPFGRDLESARALNTELLEHLDESQVFRIDHYLGKETVQNLLAFRFGNSIFEPLFNQKYVDHVQISVAETLGMEGKRGAYYDHAGALRDMVENHMLQLLTMVAMEPPSTLDGSALRDEKVKVLRCLDPFDRRLVQENTVRGQYTAGRDGKEPVRAYRDEIGVDPQSTTETYVGIRLAVDNWRWAGVPFILRTGKRLQKRVSEIAITFKQPPQHLFRELAENNGLPYTPMANVLLFHLQPDEGISLTFASKQPGMRVKLDQVRMDFYYQAFKKRSPEAYERLLLDALRGDASLFTRSDEVEHAWRFISSIQKGWAELPPPAFPNYAPFSEGPAEAQRLFAGTVGGVRSLAEP
jgi:glucose-6-phosphate 1-dehydrogenase